MISEQQITERISATPLPYSQDHMAMIFAAEYSGKMLHVGQWGDWLEWDGHIYKREPTHKAYHLIRKICREESCRPEVSEGNRRLLSQAQTISAIEKMAKSDRRLVALADSFDADPWILNTPAGILDLKLGRLRPCDPAAYCMKSAAVGPCSTTPQRWLQFLDEVFPDKEIAAYLQRLCGFWLTGLTTEHIVPFFYGGGRNGKTVFLNAIGGLLGDYARQSSVQTFMSHRNEQHPCGLATLQGARLAMVSEIPTKAAWNQEILKYCSGGEKKLTARFMRGDWFDFTPAFKLVFSGNHRPRLTSVDEAISSRLKLIPFDVTIPEDKRDPELSAKLEAEWPSILGWALQGCLQWQANGLQTPDGVKSASGDYLAAEDNMALWMSEQCNIEKLSYAPAGAAFQNWSNWCQKLGEDPGSSKAFAQDLASRGFKADKKNGIRVYKGFSLISDRGTDA